MGSLRRWQVTFACLVAVAVLLPVATAPATGLSPPSCNEATGIAVTDSGEWVLTSWERLARHDEDWDRDDWRRSPGGNDTYGVAPGPNGSLWLLQSDRVIEVSDRLRTLRTVEIAPDGARGEDAPGYGDLTYAGRWYVLFDGEVTSYNETWGNRTTDPDLEAALPPDSRGVYAEGNGIAVITGNGTVSSYRTWDNGTVEPSATVSLNTSGDVVDLHPGPNGTLLVLQTGNVTAFDGNGTSLGERVSVFSPAGCDWDGDSGYGTGLLFGLLVFLGVVAVGFLVLVAVVVVVVLYLRGR